MDGPSQGGNDGPADDHVDAAIVTVANQDRPRDECAHTRHDVRHAEPPADCADDDAQGLAQIESHGLSLPPRRGPFPNARTRDSSAQFRE
jgi:hypothetical protein